METFPNCYTGQHDKSDGSPVWGGGADVVRLHVLHLYNNLKNHFNAVVCLHTSFRHTATLLGTRVRQRSALNMYIYICIYGEVFLIFWTPHLHVVNLPPSLQRLCWSTLGWSAVALRLPQPPVHLPPPCPPGPQHMFTNIRIQ